MRQIAPIHGDNKYRQTQHDDNVRYTSCYAEGSVLRNAELCLENADIALHQATGERCLQRPKHRCDCQPNGQHARRVGPLVVKGEQFHTLDDIVS